MLPSSSLLTFNTFTIGFSERNPFPPSHFLSLQMEWKRGPIIGRGSTAAVSLATTAAGDVFAVKSTALPSSTFLQREGNIISQLCSPYVVRCLGSDTTWEENTQFYNLFLEYVPGGTLSDLIRKRGGSLDESAVRFHAFQVLQGLSYLHRVGVVHCDIKGANILIGDDGLKIADFGCAKWLEFEEDATKSGFSGTPAYMAPEVARGEEQGFAADVWALGCTVVEMATGSSPWSEMKDPASALYKIGFSGDVPEFPARLSGNARDFLTRCLMKDPRERWTAAELLQHPFFDSVGENCGENTEFTRKSPTSVTDQGFWDALEVSDSSPNPTTEIASSSDSPVSRIISLIGDAFPASLNFPAWTEEEDWFTIRDNEIDRESSKAYEQISEMNEDFEDSMETESLTSSNSQEEDSQTSNLTDYSLLDRFNGDDRISITFASTQTEPVKCSSVFKDINFEHMLNGIISSLISTLPALFSFFLFIFRKILVQIRFDSTQPIQTHQSHDKYKTFTTYCTDLIERGSGQNFPSFLALFFNLFATFLKTPFGEAKG